MDPSKKHYLYLLVAVLFEIVGTTMLKLSVGFTVLIPSVVLVISYGFAFTFLILALKTIPLSLAYSIWAGLGTAGAGLIGVLLFDEILTRLNILGLFIIIAGVVLMNLSLKTDQKK